MPYRRLSALALPAMVIACGPPAPPAAPPTTSALVRVAIAQEGLLSETVLAYGKVIPAAGAESTVTAPVETVVRRVYVVAGEPVGVGAALVTVDPSPDAVVAITGARVALETEKARLADAQRRFDLGLVTKDDLLLQQQAYRNAEARWQAIGDWGERHTSTASVAGVISQVASGVGTVVPPGTPIATLVAQSRFELALGVEPEDATFVQPGQLASFQPLSGARPDTARAGRVRAISRRIDSTTGLVSVRVSPTAGGGPLLLDDAVRATIVVSSRTGVHVPRSAVLPEGDHYLVYTVQDGRAIRHQIRLGIESDSLVEVLGGSIRAGDSVVVLGNYELQDSLPVRVEPAGSTPGSPPPSPRRP